MPRTNPRATAAPAIAPTLIKMVRDALLFRGRQCRTCRPRTLRSQWWSQSLRRRCLPASDFRLAAIAERLCRARLACGVLSVLRPCGAGTVGQGLNRGLRCRRWRRAGCSSFRTRLIGTRLLRPGKRHAALLETSTASTSEPATRRATHAVEAGARASRPRPHVPVNRSHKLLQSMSALGRPYFSYFAFGQHPQDRPRPRGRVRNTARSQTFP